MGDFMRLDKKDSSSASEVFTDIQGRLAGLAQLIGQTFVPNEEKMRNISAPQGVNGEESKTDK
jgi:hypothetical protein